MAYEGPYKNEINQLEDYIMKHCLWQFHSREWDRKRQNEWILKQTTQLLCGEEVDKSTPELKCYWVDALSMAENWQKRFAWISAMKKEEIKSMMAKLKERIDYVTITGSLNKELTVSLY